SGSDGGSPLGGTMTVIRGCDVTPIQNVGVHVQTSVSATSDPATSVTVTRTSVPGRVIYMRIARSSGAGANHNFTEGDDAGNGYDELGEMNAGNGSVRYGIGVYSTGDYNSSGGTAFEPGSGIRDSVATTDNIHYLIAVGGENQGTSALTLPKRGATALEGQVGTSAGGFTAQLPKLASRSEERRVGKEGRSRWEANE